jgi:Nucleotidyl transferase AbiEii toxin, Type IV TA system
MDRFLVLVDPRRSHRGIREDLANALKPLLGKPAESVITWVALFVRNLTAKSKIARLTYQYGPTDPTGALATLKVEVNLNETKPVFPLVTIPFEAPEPGGGIRLFDVPSYDLNEMLGTKLRALLQREHGRDLFDLWHAWRVSQAGALPTHVNPARVGQAFRFYLQQEGSDRFTAADVETEMARRMSSHKFLSDMKGYLPAGVPYDPVVAYDDFRRVFMPHL